MTSDVGMPRGPCRQRCSGPTCRARLAWRGLAGPGLAVLLLLLVVLSCSPPSARAQGPGQIADRRALLAIASALKPVRNGTATPLFWRVARWVPNAGFPCGMRQWRLINCSDTTPKRVISIDIPGKRTRGLHLTGVMPWADMTGLDALQSLNMQHQTISGEAFPRQLNALTSLTFLDLSFNNLTGLQNESIAAGPLQFLDLQSNPLGGSLNNLPHGLMSLTTLSLSNTDLTGGFPDTMSHHNTLKILKLSRNNLDVNISESIGDLKNLESLDLSFNKIPGALPAAMSDLTALKFCQVSNNVITGTFPVALLNLTALTYLDVSHNALTGEVPDQVWESKFRVDIAWNYFVGQIPANRSAFVGYTRNCFTDMNETTNSMSLVPGSRTNQSCTNAINSQPSPPPSTPAVAPPVPGATPSPSPPPPSGGSSNVGLIVGLSVAGVVLVLILIGVLIWLLLPKRDSEDYYEDEEDEDEDDDDDDEKGGRRRDDDDDDEEEEEEDEDEDDDDDRDHKRKY